MISPDLLTLFPADQDSLGKKASDLVGDDLTVKAAKARASKARR